MSVINGVGTSKIKSSWNDDDKNKVLFDKKAKSMLQSAIGMNEFFHISHCKTTKEIWDTLEVTHEDNANKVLMASHYSIDEEDEVSEYEIVDRPSFI